MTTSIYIRKLRYPEAEKKLEEDLESAFMQGVTSVEVVHGIGNGVLKKMVAEKIGELGFCKIVEIEEIATNPGVTLVELFPPSKQQLRRLKY